MSRRRRGFGDTSLVDTSGAGDSAADYSYSLGMDSAASLDNSAFEHSFSSATGGYDAVDPATPRNTTFRQSGGATLNSELDYSMGFGGGDGEGSVVGMLSTTNFPAEMGNGSSRNGGFGSQRTGGSGRSPFEVRGGATGSAMSSPASVEFGVEQPVFSRLSPTVTKGTAAVKASDFPAQPFQQQQRHQPATPSGLSPFAPKPPSANNAAARFSFDTEDTWGMQPTRDSFEDDENEMRWLMGMRPPPLVKPPPAPPSTSSSPATSRRSTHPLSAPADAAAVGGKTAMTPDPKTIVKKKHDQTGGNSRSGSTSDTVDRRRASEPTSFFMPMGMTFFEAVSPTQSPTVKTAAPTPPVTAAALPGPAASAFGGARKPTPPTGLPPVRNGSTQPTTAASKSPATTASTAKTSQTPKPPERTVSSDALHPTKKADSLPPIAPSASKPSGTTASAPVSSAAKANPTKRPGGPRQPPPRPAAWPPARRSASPHDSDKSGRDSSVSLEQSASQDEKKPPPSSQDAANSEAAKVEPKGHTGTTLKQPPRTPTPFGRRMQRPPRNPLAKGAASTNGRDATAITSFDEMGKGIKAGSPQLKRPSPRTTDRSNSPGKSPTPTSTQGLLPVRTPNGTVVPPPPSTSAAPGANSEGATADGSKEDPNENSLSASSSSSMRRTASGRMVRPTEALRKKYEQAQEQWKMAQIVHTELAPVSLNEARQQGDSAQHGEAAAGDKVGEVDSTVQRYRASLRLLPKTGGSTDTSGANPSENGRSNSVNPTGAALQHHNSPDSGVGRTGSPGSTINGKVNGANGGLAGAGKPKISTLTAIPAGNERKDSAPAQPPLSWEFGNGELLPKPPNARILVQRRVFDPKAPRRRLHSSGRSLPNGQRRADWTPPVTNYDTTLSAFTDSGEDEEGEDETPQESPAKVAMLSVPRQAFGAEYGESASVADASPPSSSPPRTTPPVSPRLNALGGNRGHRLVVDEVELRHKQMDRQHADDGYEVSPARRREAHLTPRETKPAEACPFPTGPTTPPTTSEPPSLPGSASNRPPSSGRVDTSSGAETTIKTPPSFSKYSRKRSASPGDGKSPLDASFNSTSFAGTPTVTFAPDVDFTAQ